MSIAILATPAAAWRPPTPAAAKQRRTEQPPPAELDWQDHASAEHWAEAIISFLRSDWRKTSRLWKVVNAIVAESRQPSRFDVRAASYECLQELMRLRRERRVFRYKRQWIAILDNGVPLIPLEKLRSCVPSTGRGQLTAPGRLDTPKVAGTRAFGLG